MFEPRFVEGEVRVIGHRWSPRVHQIKDFLARRRVPYRWFDLESDDEARTIAERIAPGEQRFPIVLFPDGSVLIEPELRALAEEPTIPSSARKEETTWNGSPCKTSRLGRRRSFPRRDSSYSSGRRPEPNGWGTAVARDENGFVRSGFDYMRDCTKPDGWPLARGPDGLETSVPGVFVAGDVRKGSVKRLTSAAGEGAMAAAMIHRYCALAEPHPG